MNTRPSKNFILTLLSIVLGLGGVLLLSSQSHAGDQSPSETAIQNQTAPEPVPPPSGSQPVLDTSASPGDQTSREPSSSESSSYEDGYRAGYQDGQQDCAGEATGTSASAATGSSSGYGASSRSYRKSGVAGATYSRASGKRHGHSTRNMILTIAAPAALAAGVGAIAGGKKGAGIGALVGGGGGALYYLLKHRRAG